ncbi:MAG: hypothetical protein KGD73_12715 [Candidatus Lokiarchaeota archaeon]|nr:hypothetical protein [Candidatus Lokiarchaeota archaeon]
MIPSKDKNESTLECSLCTHKKKITEEIYESYVF